MAATTPKAILDAFEAILQASPLALGRSPQAFSHDRIPNAAIQNAYYLEDGGTSARRSVTNSHEVVIDTFTIVIAKPLAFAPVDQFETMEILLVDVYRRLVADARIQGWNLEATGRRVTQPIGAELLIGSLTLRVDYDFSVSVS